MLNVGVDNEIYVSSFKVLFTFSNMKCRKIIIHNLWTIFSDALQHITTSFMSHNSMKILVIIISYIRK